MSCTANNNFYQEPKREQTPEAPNPSLLLDSTVVCRPTHCVCFGWPSFPHGIKEYIDLHYTSNVTNIGMLRVMYTVQLRL